MRTGSLRTDAALDSSATAAFKARLIKSKSSFGQGQATTSRDWLLCKRALWISALACLGLDTLFSYGSLVWRKVSSKLEAKAFYLGN